MQGPNTPLQKLRSLARRSNLGELANLINELRTEGYPDSILQSFAESLPKQDGDRHPYIYPWHAEGRRLGAIGSSPLVSIIVVSYNSSRDLARLLPTINQQSYTNWELIVIENGHEESRAIIESAISNVIYLSADNPGFAEANNLGLEHSSGELLLLLNPDVELQRETLKQLVHGISIDSSAAAACPKIYFTSPFSKITLRQPEREQFNLDFSSILDRASYRKFFVREGSTISNTAIQSSEDGRISLDIAIDPAMPEIELILWLTSDDQKTVDVFLDFEGSGEESSRLSVTAKKEVQTLAISKRINSASRYLLNNCGSGIRAESRMPFDTGFGEVDYGQFSGRRYTDAFCGCCVLLRRDLFIKRKVFISQFFAYFEDSELSFWIKSNGMNILYIPSSILYHRHSEKTLEKSDTWNLLVARSGAIYQQISESKDAHPIINSWKELKNKNPAVAQQLVDKLEAYDRHLEGRLPCELISRTEKTCVGIYNSYWSSLGGGEKHALDIASLALRLGHEVYLICEKDFSVNKLSNYFQVDLEGARKIVASEVTESLTQRFDVFINSTFRSSLISHAQLSYYVVSFPHKEVSKRFLDSYVFLHNSEYTSRWSKRYWGEHRSVVINPVLSFELRDAPSRSASTEEVCRAKEKILLSVGRFNFQGHCKNQHLIACAFKELSLQGLISDQWKLILVGSVDSTSRSSVLHFNEVKNILVDSNADVIPNASKSQLLDLYQRSSIYIHGAGMLADPCNSPEKFEHFGISVFEAIVNGCIPVVHEVGGPADQVAGLEVSLMFSNPEGLRAAIVEAINHVECLASSESIVDASPGLKSAAQIVQVSIERAKCLLDRKACYNSMNSMSKLSYSNYSDPIVPKSG